MLDQEQIKEIRKITQEELEKAGVPVKIEDKFDYSCIQGEENLRKTKEFMSVCNGNLYNTIYVSKIGERNGDARYFDLLFSLNENGEPVCLPVPIAIKLFSQTYKTISYSNISYKTQYAITGDLYEHIYKAYYKKRKEKELLPF